MKGKETKAFFKTMIQRVPVSLVFRIIGILGIVIFFLVICLIGTLLAAYIVGFVFSRYCM